MRCWLWGAKRARLYVPDGQDGTTCLRADYSRANVHQRVVHPLWQYCVVIQGAEVDVPDLTLASLVVVWIRNPAAVPSRKRAGDAACNAIGEILGGRFYVPATRVVECSRDGGDAPAAACVGGDFVPDAISQSVQMVTRAGNVIDRWCRRWQGRDGDVGGDIASRSRPERLASTEERLRAVPLCCCLLQPTMPRVQVLRAPPPCTRPALAS